MDEHTTPSKKYFPAIKTKAQLLSTIDRLEVKAKTPKASTIREENNNLLPSAVSNFFGSLSSIFWGNDEASTRGATEVKSSSRGAQEVESARLKMGS